jgi:purine nucleosidase/pyrimidine-specific ribonucleoside hydrolase
MARGAGAVTVPCILDCDPGHDDAIAMLLAAAHPAIDLRAITTVGGNGALDKVTLNARRICTLAGIDGVPIAAGADEPLAGELEVAADVHGESALDGPELPEPTVPLDPRGATGLIAATLEAATEPVTLIATGPLTNVAIALDHVDHAAIREIVWMGGSTERGNRTPYAEFNAWADPEAAAAVVTSGVPVTVIGLNLTHQALATDDVVARILALGTPLAETVAGWFDFFGATYRTLFGFPAPPVHDPCAVALVADPATVRTVEAFVAIETEGAWTRGATVVDLDARLGEAPNARVGVELDVPRFWDLVVEAVDRLGR